MRRQNSLAGETGWKRAAFQLPRDGWPTQIRDARRGYPTWAECEEYPRRMHDNDQAAISRRGPHEPVTASTGDASRLSAAVQRTAVLRLSKRLSTLVFLWFDDVRRAAAARA